MTRDEAIKIYLEHVGPFTKKTLPPDILTETVEHGIDGMVALGILKLDEPKDKARELFMDIIEGYGDLQAGDAQRILASVERNGLRIVEK